MALKGSSNSRRLVSDLRADFWKLVRRDTPDSCWPWLAGCGGYGYGTVTADTGTGRRKHNAHALAFFLANGWMPGRADGLVVRHVCDNPRCCNPAHLISGTPAQNMADAVRRGRMASGERAGQARLTAEQVDAIRSALDAGRSARHIGKAFGVSAGAIHHIRTGSTWRERPAETPGLDVVIRPYTPQGADT